MPVLYRLWRWKRRTGRRLSRALGVVLTATFILGILYQALRMMNLLLVERADSGEPAAAHGAGSEVIFWLTIILIVLALISAVLSVMGKRGRAREAMKARGINKCLDMLDAFRETTRQYTDTYLDGYTRGRKTQPMAEERTWNEIVVEFLTDIQRVLVEEVLPQSMLQVLKVCPHRMPHVEDVLPQSEPHVEHVVHGTNE